MDHQHRFEIGVAHRAPHGSPGGAAVLVGNEARQTSSCLNAFGHSNLSGG
jgi:hypothetical protein